jgi:hypothetical protein
MTSKQAFEYALVELNKREAPSLLLEDYNYFFNKAVNQFINRMYNAYDLNQQKTDDLRVLKGTALLSPTINAESTSASTLFNKTYEVDLPDDYLHILNCIVEYKVKKNYKCYNQNDTWQQGAKRLTADMFSQIINNYYLRPSYKQPYYYVNNVVDNFNYPINDAPTPINPSGTVINNFLITFGTPGTTNLTIIKDTENIVIAYNAVPVSGVSFSTAANLQPILSALHISSVIIGTNLLINNAAAESITAVTASGSYLTITSGTISDTNGLVERSPEYRYGNRSKVRMEIRYGKDNATFELQSVLIDYLKVPQFVRLTQSQVDEVEDNSQLLEFPDYVCQEIVNELIKLLMENSSDPRLQSHIPINQSIANPAQEQQSQPKK